MRDYRNRIREKRDKAQVSLNEEKKPKYLIDGKYRRYDDAVQCLSDKFEAMQSTYDSGNYYEGMWQLSIIANGLKELPEDSETEVLRQQYEYWGELFAKLEYEAI